MADEAKRNTSLTFEGKKLMAKCFAGNTLNISRIVLGDGNVPEGIDDIREIAAVQSPKMELPVVYKKVDGTGTAIVECALKNAGLEHGFWASELGVYATDPDTGDEVLYAYRNTGKYAEYVPSYGSGEILDTVIAILIVVDQIENVNVTIEEGVGSVSRAEYYRHLNETNPHPQAFQFGDKVTDCQDVFVGTGEARRFHRIGIDDMRKKILGANTSTLPIMNGRLSQLEIEMANLGIRLDGPPNIIVSSVAPDNPSAVWFKVKPEYDSEFAGRVFDDLDLSNMAFYDEFNPVQEVETLKVSANAITAGSRTIGVASLDDIKPGTWLTVTDGVNSEDIQVKSSSKNDGVLRIITTEDIVKTYRIGSTVIQRTTADMTTKVAGVGGKRGIRLNTGENIVSLTHEFSGDGIRALAFAQAMMHHDALTTGRLRAYVTFSDEVQTAADVSIGTTTGERQTVQLPDTGVDYNTIEIKVGGVKFVDFSANTEPSHPEITLTAEEAGQEITASYKYGYGVEVWNEMELVSQQEYGDSGRAASKFEYALPEGRTAATRTAMKFVYESDTDGTPGSTVVYAVEIGWAKAAENV